MAKGRQRTAPANPPTVGPEQALSLLRMQSKNGQALLDNGAISEGEEQAWEAATEEALRRSFGSDSPNINRVMSVGQWAMYGGGTDEQYAAQRMKDMKDRMAIIDGLIELIATDVPAQGTTIEVPVFGQSVFLVHGHDEAIIHQTARFIENLDLDVIILREQANKGRTIIEKFEDYANVGFAVVLLTADDRGGTASTPADELKPRARQNVIFELGFFIGRLRRMRVCALYEQGVEIPSDYSGVLFVPIDQAGMWKFALAKEMREAGLPVDMNKALSVAG